MMEKTDSFIPPQWENILDRYNEAERLRLAAKKYEDMDWSYISSTYQKVVDDLKNACKDAARGISELRPDFKMYAVHSLIYSCYALMLIERKGDAEGREYDVAPKVKNHIHSLEREIKPFGFEKKELYNILQQTYDEWCEEWRNIGMKYEADELQYYMLKARMKWNLFNLSKHLVKLALFLDNINEKIDDWGKRGPKLIREIINWPGRLFDTIRAFLEWVLYSIGKSLFWPLFLFIACPIVICAVFYFRSDCVGIVDRPTQSPVASCVQCSNTTQTATPVPSPTPTIAPLQRFTDNLAYSVIVFTGSDSGSLSVCPQNHSIHWLMALEAISAYLSMLIVVGYLVNRLASR